MAAIDVNGKTYELVALDDITLDEAMVVWDYTKLSLDQIPDLEGFHPGLTAALIHIAIGRAEPDEKPRAIRQAVGRIRLTDLEQMFADISEETEPLPPPNRPDSTSSSGGSGEDSSPTGEPGPALSPVNGSGNPGSATGATSDPATSA